MAIFNVLEPPDGNPQRVAFIREGFSWGALVFTVLWALFHRMWLVAAMLFVGFAVVAVAEAWGLMGPVLAGAVNFAIALLFGFEARKFQSMSLERAGFRPAALIEATGLEAAELAYFAGRAPAMPVSAASVRLPGQPVDTLGLFGNV